jgi:hypothetical protein
MDKIQDFSSNGTMVRAGIDCGGFRDAALAAIETVDLIPPKIVSPDDYGINDRNWCISPTQLGRSHSSFYNTETNQR